MTKKKFFSQDDILIIDAATELARNLVADHFKLDFENFLSWPVDIKIYKELAPEEKTEGVLAQLLRYNRTGAILKNVQPDYYRICLYDPAVFTVLARKPNLTLAALLTYILTHEFIHVARFARFMEIFDQDDFTKNQEEQIVHQLTVQLLQKAKIEGLELVFDLYQNHRLPLD